MSNVAYDPIKDRLTALISGSRLRRKLFYFFLDLVFLRSWYVHRYLKKIASQMGREDNKEILDAGCGFGQYDSFMLKKIKNVRIKSVDIKEHYLSECRVYFKKQIQDKKICFENVDLHNLKYHEKFDLVLCVDVLEHIEDDDKVLKNFYNSLKKEGKLLVHSPVSDSAEVKKKANFSVDEHYRQGYSASEIKEKFFNSGLVPETLAYTYGTAGYFAWNIGVRVPLSFICRSNKIWFFLLFFYLPLIFPLFLILNLADFVFPVKRGKGILVVGKKE